MDVPAGADASKQGNHYNNAKHQAKKGGNICSVGTTSQNALTECVRMGRRIVVTNATTESVMGAGSDAVMKCADMSTLSAGFVAIKSDHRAKGKHSGHEPLYLIHYITPKGEHK